ncbi:MAG: M23 family metallopeptidase [Chloroflexota bacterium]|nr:M23 family metallopeptidase [Chloroflexota bacterium]
MKPTKNMGPLALFGWGALVVVLVAGAYAGGSILARHWMVPSLALLDEFPLDSASTPAPRSALWIAAGEPQENTLGAEIPDEWQFEGQAGQAATIEMWLHPGSGSNVDAEMVVRLLAPDGTILVEEQGSAFLPPYLFEPSLPATGLYRVEVMPVGGAPGRYSIGLSVSETVTEATPNATPARPTGATPNSAAAAAAKLFQWPTTRRRISGWTYHDPRNPAHIGLDIAAEMWDPIVAVAHGEVVFADWAGGYGNLVIVEHGSDWRSYYAHLTEIAVTVGQQLRQGETLGAAGTTGHSTGPHLHFELRYRDRPVDPHIYLP